MFSTGFLALLENGAYLFSVDHGSYRSQEFHSEAFTRTWHTLFGYDTISNSSVRERYIEQSITAVFLLDVFSTKYGAYDLCPHVSPTRSIAILLRRFFQRSESGRNVRFYWVQCHALGNIRDQRQHQGGDSYYTENLCFQNVSVRLLLLFFQKDSWSANLLCAVQACWKRSYRYGVGHPGH